MSEETILIIDDNPTNLGLLFNYLETKGFKVLVDTDGESALKAVNKVKPDIILLDILMPGADGFEICRRLKANFKTCSIPVVFMTALTDSSDEVKGLELGAVDYITKPLQVEKVLARVTTHLTIRSLQKQLQEKNDKLEERNDQLQEALDDIKTLTGLLPICTNCKKIKDDEGYWSQLEQYFSSRSDVLFSHGLCPDCSDALYGNQDWYIRWKAKTAS
ncbi:response regulator [Desulfococcaceae bacterium HSG7]|nr:response regulator [Desulfococcaceae bacterium HSG7]